MCQSCNRIFQEIAPTCSECGLIVTGQVFTCDDKILCENDFKVMLMMKSVVNSLNQSKNDQVCNYSARHWRWLKNMEDVEGELLLNVAAAEKQIFSPKFSAVVLHLSDLGLHRRKGVEYITFCL